MDERSLAIMMGLHARLGQASLLRCLDENSLSMVSAPSFTFQNSTHSSAPREKRKKKKEGGGHLVHLIP